MQTLLDKSEALRKEIESLKTKIENKKRSPIPKKPAATKQPKKSVMASMRGLVGLGAGTEDKSPKQLEAINQVQDLLLRKAYDEVELYVEANKKLLFGKVKRNQEIPTPFRLQDETGETVLMKAIKDGQVDLALDWLEKGSVFVDICDDDGETPLMVAARFGETDIVKSMVKKANKDAKTNFTKKTALHYAAAQGHSEVVTLLLDNGCSVTLEDSNGSKAFQVAPDREIREMIVAVMKSQGAGPSEEELKECDETFREEEEALIQSKNRSYSNDEEMRPLYEEQERLMKDKKRLELRLEDITKKRSPKHKFEQWKEELDEAGKKKVLGLNDNDVDTRVRKLHALVSRGEDNDAVDQVEELLTDEKKKKLQIDRDAPDEYGETALMKAARLGFDEMVSLLLLYKCSTEIKDVEGYTALMKAAQFGKKECVQKLIGEGADLNASSRKGKKTALMLAAESSHADICELLIAEGADHGMINSDGKKAVDLTKNTEARERIEKAMEEYPVNRAPVQI